MEKNQTIIPLNVLEVMLQEKALLTRTQKEKKKHPRLKKLL